VSPQRVDKDVSSNWSKRSSMSSSRSLWKKNMNVITNGCRIILGMGSILASLSAGEVLEWHGCGGSKGDRSGAHGR
jgi:hypothetical protein